MSVALKRVVEAVPPPGTDPLWERLIREAHDVAASEPVLRRLVDAVMAGSFEQALVTRLAQRLAGVELDARELIELFASVASSDATLLDASRADLAAVLERDPATTRLIEPLLFYKGFHAVQTHRFAHALWMRGRRDVALLIQSRSSSVFATDIHPAAPFGKGVFLDHATGLVVGATSVVEDNVSILQGVTLGGTGKDAGDRHPKIRRGVLIGAGASILGPIEIGACARVAAGSVVLQPVPPHKTVAGVPARIVGEAGCREPSRRMDHTLDLGAGI